MLNRTSKNRRGIILLIVLTLLVLFSLIGITFLVVASRYRTTAIQVAAIDRFGDPPSKLLEEALGQLLYGPRTPRSAMAGHDVLGDLYGNDGVLTQVTNASTDTNVNQQFLVLTLTAAAGYQLPGATDGTASYGYYNGCVLTVLDGNARGYSTRITGYSFNSGTATVHCEAFESDYPQTVLPASGNRVWINGHPFNGTGAGYNYNSGTTVTRMTDSNFNQPYALMPNYRTYLNTVNAGLPGGADEGYDAADYQNMFLSAYDRSDPDNPRFLPSFHRWDLCLYWASQNPTLWGNDNFIRQVVLRPLPSDHPNFTGSNSQMAAAANWRGNLASATGVWDVDNDGDGVPDSIWIDLGYPAVAGKDGRMYKPLFAFLVKDLDGRFDMNAHMHQKHFDTNYNTPPSYQFFAGNTGGAPINVRQGAGAGPAGIKWSHLTGAAQQIVNNRYNANETPSPLPGKPYNSADYDVSAFLNKIGLPRAGAAVGSGGFGQYGAPFDLLDLGRIAVDANGHPVPLYQFQPNDTVDWPYEIDLVRKPGTGFSSVDNPFTMAELECLLRGYDPDARALPQRLYYLDQNAFNPRSDNGRAIAALAGAGKHIPVPSHLIPPRKWSGAQVPNPQTLFRPNTNNSLYVSTTLVDLARAKLMAGGVTEPNLTTELKKLIPWEILKGGRMDINRFLGNGYDNNPGVGPNVNDPSSYYAWDFGAGGVTPAPSNHVNVTPNYTNNDPAANGSLNQQQSQRYAKQIYARHLYILMRLLMDDAFQQPTTTASGASINELTSQRIAQWAINVVDYRDPDSIMTGFEYDLDPFDNNGWAVDGDLATSNDAAGANRRVVFGVEFPDLVITEAIAFHDKRLKDTNIDTPPKKRKKMDQEAEDDDDLDQYRIPQGSLYFEIYCARGQQVNNPIFPQELYDTSNPAMPQLMLERLAPASPNLGGLQFPVWRIAISQYHGSGAGMKVKLQTGADQMSFQPTDLNSLVTPVTSTPDPMPIERYVWFTTQQPQAGHLDAGKDFTNQDIFYNRGGSPRLGPTQYGVVGPRSTTYFGTQINTDATMPDQLAVQKIQLAANSVVTTSITGGVETRNAAVGIVCGAQHPTGWTAPGTTAPQGIGLNVTEPLPQKTSYYPEPGVQLTGYPVQDAYDSIQTPSTMAVADAPADYVAGKPITDNGMQKSGTYLDTRTAFVQRLADPTQPYDPNGNPYVTLDWIPIDVTVFNGEDREPANFFSMGNFDPTDPNPNDNSGQQKRLATREKGDNTNFNLWSPLTGDPAATATESGDTTHNYRFDLMAAASPRRETLGTLNAKFGTPGTYGAPYDQAPATPFPWLPVANRPFISPYEMMLVPSCTQARLGFEFTLGQPGMDPYAGADAQNFRAPYGYLLNFLHTSDLNGSAAANFHRLFDFVEVPSRYDGTARWYDSNTFAGAPPGSSADFYRPPYNKLPRFREPGPVNINTIYDASIWTDGATGGILGSSNVPWSTVATSRAGGALGTVPSLFSNPFRPGAAAELVPIDPKPAEIDVTLLRRNPPGPGNQPLFADTSVQAYNSMQRHPYFRYETLVSLGNRLKTTSNVFAVWLTVGYFEVTQPPAGTAFNPGVPDGWYLGQELGTDTGEIKRHRSFYIIDRSIPVAAQPGEANNTERTILLRRYID